MRIGIIGAGSMAARHLAAYRATPGVEVVAMAGRTDAHRDRFLAEPGMEHFYTDHRALLDAGGVEAVSVTTPTATHAEIARDSLLAGCHVLCEKPIAMTMDDANQMVLAAERAERVLMTGFVMRFFPEFQELKRRIDAGQIGEVRSTWLRKSTPLPTSSWYGNPELCGGVLFELGIHLIDLARWWGDSPIERVSAVLRGDVHPFGTDDTAWLLLEFASGAVASLGAAFTHAVAGRDSGVVGTRGALAVLDGRVVADGEPADVAHPRQDAPGDPFEAEIGHFVACIRDGKQPTSDGQAGARSLAVALAAEVASRRGASVSISERLLEELSGADAARYLA